MKNGTVAPPCVKFHVETPSAVFNLRGIFPNILLFHIGPISGGIQGYTFFLGGGLLI